jgi:hypothetical protein
MCLMRSYIPLIDTLLQVNGCVFALKVLPSKLCYLITGHSRCSSRRCQVAVSANAHQQLPVSIFGNPHPIASLAFFFRM